MLKPMLNRLTAAFALAASLTFFATAVSAATPEVGKKYFTAYNFMVEKERHPTTNYWRGEMIPLNTKVGVKKLTSRKMVLDIDGRSVTIVNVKKYTKRSMQEIAAEMLSSRKVRTGQKFRSSIKSGRLRLGMTKKQVLMTRGYPPAHKTPSTKSNRWVYWNSRFVQRTLVFEDDKLVEGRGLD